MIKIVYGKLFLLYGQLFVKDEIIMSRLRIFLIMLNNKVQNFNCEKNILDINGM